MKTHSSVSVQGAAKDLASRSMKAVAIAVLFGFARLLVTISVFWHFMGQFDFVSTLLLSLSVKIALDHSVFKMFSAVCAEMIRRVNKGEKAIQFNVRVRSKEERIARKLEELDRLGGMEDGNT